MSNKNIDRDYFPEEGDAFMTALGIIVGVVLTMGGVSIALFIGSVVARLLGIGG